MFQLERSTVRLQSFNPRTELHGKDGHLAGDLKFETNQSPDILAHFSPELRHFLFWKRDGAQDDLVNQTHDAPNLRFPMLSLPLKWEMELTGAELVIHYGPSGKGDITLPSCRVNAFSIEPKEGGTCIVGFRVQSELDDKIAGKICSLIQQPCEISITPPAEGSLVQQQEAA